MESFNTTIVSVEPTLISSPKLFLSAFQYNHCFGGTSSTWNKWAEYIVFQYNHCFGGTNIQTELTYQN